MVLQITQECYILKKINKTFYQTFMQTVNTNYWQIVSTILILATNPMCLHQFNCKDSCDFILMHLSNNIITSR